MFKKILIKSKTTLELSSIHIYIEESECSAIDSELRLKFLLKNSQKEKTSLKFAEKN